MTMTEARVGTVPFYNNGAWEKRRARAIHPVTNPATGAMITEVVKDHRAGVRMPSRFAVDLGL
jgi:hypothetical protein